MNATTDGSKSYTIIKAKGGPQISKGELFLMMTFYFVWICMAYCKMLTLKEILTVSSSIWA